MSIEKELESWAKTPAGKKALGIAKVQALVKGKLNGGVAYRTAELTAEYYANYFKEILSEELAKYGWNFSDWLKIYNSELTIDGKIMLELDFDQDKNSRDSLQPSLYPEGVYDLVALLNHGYDADGMVYGFWESKQIDTWSLPKREGLYFMQRAADRFNMLCGSAGGAFCYLDSKYD